MINTVIHFLIPLHKWDPVVKRAIESIPDVGNVHIYVVTTNEIGPKLNGLNCERIITSDKDTSYPALVNVGIQHVQGDIKESNGDRHYISILEYDDELYPNAIGTFLRYESEDEDIDIYAPLVSFVEEDENAEDPEKSSPKLLSFGNEACWAGGLPETLGIFDFNMMLRMNFIFMNSCFINIDCFEDGLLKKKIKVFYDYEFMLRMVYNGKIIKGIPKLTHKHWMNPAGAMVNLINTLSNEERDFWLATARKEYFYPSDEDREIEYSD